jgi:GT2 family glycosyltransferase
MTAEAAIIILNWNGWADTMECLGSLLRVTDVDFDVVVVDNASSDGSVAELTRWIESQHIPLTVSSKPYPCSPGSDNGREGYGLRQVVLVCLPENTGFCGGNNTGLRYAQMLGVPYAIILNNDTTVDPAFLSPLLAFARAHPSIGLLGAQIRYAADRGKVWWAGGGFSLWLGNKWLYDGQSCDRVPEVPYRTGWVTGCMTFLPLAVFAEVGGFDERFFFWCEDRDLSLRVGKAGYEMMVVPSSIVYHKGGASLGWTSPLTYYYSIRNLFLLRREHLPRWIWDCFLVVYMPYKLAQALYCTVKSGPSFWWAYQDAVWDFVWKRFGQWDRHRERNTVR